MQASLAGPASRAIRRPHRYTSGPVSREGEQERAGPPFTLVRQRTSRHRLPSFMTWCTDAHVIRWWPAAPLPGYYERFIDLRLLPRFVGSAESGRPLGR